MRSFIDKFVRNVFRSKLVVHGTIMEGYMIGQDPYILVQCDNVTIKLAKVKISKFLEVKHGLLIVIHFVAKKTVTYQILWILKKLN